MSVRRSLDAERRILPSRGNTATQVVTATIPQGTTVFTGFAAAQGGLVGGGDRGSKVLQASDKGNIPHELAKRAQFLNERLSEPEDQEQDPTKRAIIVEVEAAKTDDWMIAQ